MKGSKREKQTTQPLPTPISNPPANLPVQESTASVTASSAPVENSIQPPIASPSPAEYIPNQPIANPELPASAPRTSVGKNTKHVTVRLEPKAITEKWDIIEKAEQVEIIVGEAPFHTEMMRDKQQLQKKPQNIQSILPITTQLSLKKLPQTTTKLLKVYFTPLQEYHPPDFFSATTKANWFFRELKLSQAGVFSKINEITKYKLIIPTNDNKLNIDAAMLLLLKISAEIKHKAKTNIAKDKGFNLLKSLPEISFQSAEDLNLGIRLKDILWQLATTGLIYANTIDDKVKQQNDKTICQCLELQDYARSIYLTLCLQEPDDDEIEKIYGHLHLQANQHDNSGLNQQWLCYRQCFIDFTAIHLNQFRINIIFPTKYKNLTPNYNFSGCYMPYLTMANNRLTTLQELNFTNAYLAAATFENCQFESCDFSQVYLSKHYNMQDQEIPGQASKLTNTQFIDCKLNALYLHSSSLENVLFKSTQEQGLISIHHHLDFTNTELNNLKISNLILKQTIIDTAQIETENTKIIPPLKLKMKNESKQASYYFTKAQHAYLNQQWQEADKYYATLIEAITINQKHKLQSQEQQHSSFKALIHRQAALAKLQVNLTTNTSNTITEAFLLDAKKTTSRLTQILNVAEHQHYQNTACLIWQLWLDIKKENHPRIAEIRNISIDTKRQLNNLLLTTLENKQLPETLTDFCQTNHLQLLYNICIEAGNDFEQMQQLLQSYREFINTTAATNSSQEPFLKNLICDIINELRLDLDNPTNSNLSFRIQRQQFKQFWQTQLGRIWFSLFILFPEKMQQYSISFSIFNSDKKKNINKQDIFITWNQQLFQVLPEGMREAFVELWWQFDENQAQQLLKQFTHQQNQQQFILALKELAPTLLENLKTIIFPDGWHVAMYIQQTKWLQAVKSLFEQEEMMVGHTPTMVTKQIAAKDISHTIQQGQTVIACRNPDALTDEQGYNFTSNPDDLTLDMVALPEEDISQGEENKDIKIKRIPTLKTEPEPSSKPSYRLSLSFDEVTEIATWTLYCKNIGRDTKPIVLRQANNQHHALLACLADLDIDAMDDDVVDEPEEVLNTIRHKVEQANRDANKKREMLSALALLLRQPPEYYILDSVVQKQLKSTEDKILYRAKERSSRHILMPFEHQGRRFWLKIFPENPGMEYAIHQLHGLLGGSEDTPPVWLWRVFSKNYPDGLAALLIADVADIAMHHGINEPLNCYNLSQALKKKQASVLNIDQSSYTRHLLRVLLTNPEDDKSDDYWLIKQLETEQFNLCRIDSERSFYLSELFNNTKQPEKILRENSKATLQTTTVIYYLTNIEQALSEEVLTRFLRLHPQEVMKRWLTALIRWNQDARVIFSAHELHHSSISIALTHATSHVYQKPLFGDNAKKHAIAREKNVCLPILPLPYDRFVHFMGTWIATYHYLSQKEQRNELKPIGRQFLKKIRYRHYQLYFEELGLLNRVRPCRADEYFEQRFPKKYQYSCSNKQIKGRKHHQQRRTLSQPDYQEEIQSFDVKEALAGRRTSTVFGASLRTSTGAQFQPNDHEGVIINDSMSKNTPTYALYHFQQKGHAHVCLSWEYLNHTLSQDNISDNLLTHCYTIFRELPRLQQLEVIQRFLIKTKYNLLFQSQTRNRQTNSLTSSIILYPISESKPEIENKQHLIRWQYSFIPSLDVCVEGEISHPFLESIPLERTEKGVCLTKKLIFVPMSTEREIIETIIKQHPDLVLTEQEMTPLLSPITQKRVIQLLLHFIERKPRSFETLDLRAVTSEMTAKDWILFITNNHQTLKKINASGAAFSIIFEHLNLLNDCEELTHLSLNDLTGVEKKNLFGNRVGNTVFKGQFNRLEALHLAHTDVLTEIIINAPLLKKLHVRGNLNLTDITTNLAGIITNLAGIKTNSSHALLSADFNGCPKLFDTILQTYGRNISKDILKFPITDYLLAHYPKEIKELLAANSDSEEHHIVFKDALFRYALEGKVVAIDQLLEHYPEQVSLDEQDKHGYTILQFAEMHEQHNIVDHLIKAYPKQINVMLTTGVIWYKYLGIFKQALFRYISKGDIQAMSELLQNYHQSSLHDKDKHDNTVLLVAAKHGQIKTIDYLLKNHLKQASFNESNKDNDTILLIAAKHDQYKTIDYLLRNYPKKINTMLMQKNNKYKYQLVFKATWHRYVDDDNADYIINVLLRHYPEQVNFLADEIDHLIRNHSKAVHVMLEDNKDKAKFHYILKSVLLFYYISKGKIQAIDDLLQHYPEYISLDEANEDGDTVLLVAAKNNQIETAEHLLRTYPEAINTMLMQGNNQDRHQSVFKEVLLHCIAMDSIKIFSCLLQSYPEQISLVLSHAAIDSDTWRIGYLLQKHFKWINTILATREKDKDRHKLVFKAMLFRYIAEGDIQFTNSLLQNHPQQVTVNEANEDGDTVLLVAAKNNQIETAEHLLRTYPEAINTMLMQGNNQDRHQSVFKEVLLHCIAMDSIKIFSCLLQSYPEQISLVLSHAAIDSDTWRIGYLLQKHFKWINTILTTREKDKDRHKLVFKAMLFRYIAEGDIQFTNSLLQNHPQQVTVNEVNEDGDTVLLVAAKYGQINTIDHLLRTYPKEINTMLEKSEDKLKYNSVFKKALFRYASKGRVQSIDDLLRHYAEHISLDKTNEDGDTVLLVAAKYGQINMFDHLLRTYFYQVSLDDKNKHSDTALLLAAKNYETNAIDHLLQTYPEQINVMLKKSKDKVRHYSVLKKALFRYASTGKIQAIGDLLRHYAEYIRLDETNEDGDTVLLVAAKSGQYKIIDYLLYTCFKKVNAMLMQKDNKNKHQSVFKSTWYRYANGGNTKDMIDNLFQHYPEQVDLLTDKIDHLLQTYPKEINAMLEKSEDKVRHHSVFKRALFRYTSEGKIQAIGDLLRHYAEYIRLDETNEDGDTVLLVAAKSGQYKIIDYLLYTCFKKVNAMLMQKDNKNKHQSVFKSTWYRYANGGNTKDMIDNLFQHYPEQVDLLTDKIDHLLQTYPKEINAMLEKSEDKVRHHSVFKRALFRYTSEGKIQAIDDLLHYYADHISLDEANEDGDTVLSVSAKYGQIEMLDHLLKDYPKKISAILEKDRNQEKHKLTLKKTFFRYTSEEKTESIDNLLQHYAKYFSLDKTDEDNDRALLRAASNGSIEIVEFLLAAGANLTAVNDDGFRALQCAAMNRKEDLMFYLLEKEYGVKKGQEIIHLSLHDIISFREEGAIVQFKQRDFSSKIAQTDEQGNTLLHCAAGFATPLVLERLLQTLNKKAIQQLIVTTNNRGLTPLHLAAMRLDADSLKLILPYCKGMKHHLLRDKRKFTPLRIAMECSNEESIKLLLQQEDDYTLDLSANNLYDRHKLKFIIDKVLQGYVSHVWTIDLSYNCLSYQKIKELREYIQEKRNFYPGKIIYLITKHQQVVPIPLKSQQEAHSSSSDASLLVEDAPFSKQAELHIEKKKESAKNESMNAEWMDIQSKQVRQQVSDLSIKTDNETPMDITIDSPKARVKLSLDIKVKREQQQPSLSPNSLSVSKEDIKNMAKLSPLWTPISPYMKKNAEGKEEEKEENSDNEEENKFTLDYPQPDSPPANTLSLQEQLIIACTDGNTEEVDCLVKQGAILSNPTLDNFDAIKAHPLTAAIHSNKPEILRRLYDLKREKTGGKGFRIDELEKCVEAALDNQEFNLSQAMLDYLSAYGVTIPQLFNLKML